MKTLMQQQGWNPIPVANLDGTISLTDGHTRALLLYLNGCQKIECVFEDEALDWDEYRFYVSQCRRLNIFTIGDLANRILPHSECTELWINYCQRVRSRLF